MTKKMNQGASAVASRKVEIVNLKEFGHGYKFTVQTFYEDGRVHRSLAAVTSADGRGLVIGGVIASNKLDWRNHTLKSAYDFLVQLLIDHPEWIPEQRGSRRATV